MPKGKAEYWRSKEGLALIVMMVEEKATDEQVAARLQISRSTLSAWKKKYPEIGEAMQFDADAANRRKYAYWLMPDGLMLIAAWTRNGLTDEQLAARMDISRSTLSEWKIKYPQIAGAMARSKDAVDVEVENALLQNAIGYEYEEEVAFKCKKVWYDEKGRRVEEEHLETKWVTRKRPGETAAQFIWLKNRRKDVWRDKQELELRDNSINLNMEIIDKTEKVD